MDVYAAQHRGIRSHMEDTYSIDVCHGGRVVVAVYDGHGGDEVAQYLADNFGKRLARVPLTTQAIADEFVRTDARVTRRFRHSGSTACVAVVDADRVWFANCGDSMAAIGRRGRPAVHVASREHKVSLELPRLRALGANITYTDGTARINGGLNVSRSFGDRDSKEFVTAEPYVRSEPRRGTEYIVLATDGVWDVMDAHAIDAIVRSSPEDKAAANLVREARARRSGDNMTAVVMFMHGKKGLSLRRVGA